MIRLQGNAIDLAVWKPPTRTTVNADGETVLEKLPTQRSKYMLNPSGHGVWVALHCGSSLRNPNDPIAIRRYDEKSRRGFLPFDRCPQTMDPDIVQKHLPKAMRGRSACSSGSADVNRPISNGNPCKCLVEVMELRRKANDKIMAEAEARLVTKSDKDFALRERQIAALEKQTAELARRSKPARED